MAMQLVSEVYKLRRVVGLLLPAFNAEFLICAASKRTNCVTCLRMSSEDSTPYFLVCNQYCIATGLLEHSCSRCHVQRCFWNEL
ncbi:hypothetical protein F5878DRAFT_635379 [Lentinula raphanica]|uniref:Uncharacterized protein n=1 Tax=Lentinula raphanica TaxID=153919 RepID=A0AA38U4L4_9AGAR|nr:hypothetical protein F5878DRAFT_635379 [Lentinula raphanica]